MADTVYLRPNDGVPDERHIRVVVRQYGPRQAERGYFYDSAEGDDGGGSPFDWNMDEAIARAQKAADSKAIRLVVVKAEPA